MVRSLQGGLRMDKNYCMIEATERTRDGEVLDDAAWPFLMTSLRVNVNAPSAMIPASALSDMQYLQSFGVF